MQNTNNKSIISHLESRAKLFILTLAAFALESCASNIHYTIANAPNMPIKKGARVVVLETEEYFKNPIKDFDKPIAFSGMQHSPEWEMRHYPNWQDINTKTALALNRWLIEAIAKMANVVSPSTSMKEELNNLMKLPASNTTSEAWGSWAKKYSIDQVVSSKVSYLKVEEALKEELVYEFKPDRDGKRTRQFDRSMPYLEQNPRASITYSLIDAQTGKTISTSTISDYADWKTTRYVDPSVKVAPNPVPLIDNDKFKAKFMIKFDADMNTSPIERKSWLRWNETKTDATVRARLLARDKNYAEAANAFKADWKARHDKESGLNASILMLASGNTSGAASMINEVLNLYPDYTEAKKMAGQIALSNHSTPTSGLI